MLETRVAEWDLADPVTGQRLSAELQKLVKASASLSSAWVTDPSGVSRLDNGTYPARPVFAEREYSLHSAGENGILILGDETPGSASGRKWFTVSRPVRNADDLLHAAIAVGIYAEVFQKLYGEVARWPDARAGPPVVCCRSAGALLPHAKGAVSSLSAQPRAYDRIRCRPTNSGRTVYGPRTACRQCAPFRKLNVGIRHPKNGHSLRPGQKSRKGGVRPFAVTFARSYLPEQWQQNSGTKHKGPGGCAALAAYVYPAGSNLRSSSPGKSRTECQPYASDCVNVAWRRPGRRTRC